MTLELQRSITTNTCGYGSLRSQGRRRCCPRAYDRPYRVGFGAAGGDRRPADRRRASDARNRAGRRAPCRRRRRIPGSRDRRPASGRWPRSVPAATAAGSSAPRCRRRSDRAPSRLRRRARARCCRARPGATPASSAGRGAPCAAAGRPRRGSWRGRTGPAGAPCRSRRFASHFRVPRRSGWPKVRLPRASSVARRDRRTRSIPSSHSSLRIAPANRGQRWRCHSSQKSLRSESLSPRRARKPRPNVYAVQNGLLGSELPHEMSYPTAQTLQYGGTRAQESAPMRPHVPTSRHCSACFPPHRNPTD